jgi:Zn-dependent peptidase ImmA (M78 family)
MGNAHDTFNPAEMLQVPEVSRADCREANAFAMALLMPEDWLRRDIEKLGGIDIEDVQKVGKLAKRYRVSVQVMTLRIGQLMGNQE